MAESAKLACVKAYDIRGRVPDELNPDIAYRLGAAYACFTGARRVAVGYDMRLSAGAIVDGLVRGLTEAGTDVLDIGLSGTEEIYFATAHFELDGGIAVTASHNPADYNGMKLVREGARPVSSDTGLGEIEQMAINGVTAAKGISSGSVMPLDHRCAYIEHLLGCVDVAALKPLKIVCNPGNGTAGAVVERLCEHLPVDLVRMQWEPDGRFPNGVPNPLLPENRALTRELVLESGADLGLAWDGDFDRCFFFDAKGRFIEGYYLVGLLAEVMLSKQPGANIIHDPRLTWNTVDVVTRAGGNPVVTKTGHAFIKERMRLEDAIYGGEMSAHHYFRDFFYCDSGMLPWLLVYELMSRKNMTLAALVDASMAAYPCSGELNFKVGEPKQVLQELESRYAGLGRVDRTDGLSVDLDRWRFNVRASNTEPLLRLNVETRSDAAAMAARTDELSTIIHGFGV